MMRRLGLGLAMCAASIGAVHMFGNYGQYVISQFCVLVIITAGLNLLMGVAGLLSVASAAFVGVGANVATIAMLKLGFPYPLAIVGALVAGWTVGWGIGLLSLRVGGFYLAVVTLGFLQVFLVTLELARGVTGGGYGLVVPPASLPFIGELAGAKLAGFSVVLAIIVLALLHRLMSSRFGRSWVALKDHPAAAELSGIDPVRYKTLAFAMSSLVVSLGGALQAVLLGVTNPSAYSAFVSITHISYVVVGGMAASIVGPIMGPLVLFVVPELVRDLGEYREIFFGGVMLLAMIAAPRGIAGLADDLLQRSMRKKESAR